MAAYPSTLPRPQQDGYGLAPVDPLVSTDMEVGASRSRRRTKARQDIVEVVWEFSDAEFVTFRDWYDNTINGGASWFDVHLIVGKGGVTLELAKFKEIWKSSLKGTYWKVTGKLEVR